MPNMLLSYSLSESNLDSNMDISHSYGRDRGKQIKRAGEDELCYNTKKRK